MHLVHIFFSSTAKMSTVTLISYFMILIGTVLPFNEKKRHKSMFSSLAMLLKLYRLSYNGSNSVCSMQIKSTLECKIKTRALKGVFLVHKWINNTFESNSVRYHIDLFCLSSFGLCTVFAKVPWKAVFASTVMLKWARWPPLFITFLLSFWLVTSVYQVSSTMSVRFFY